MKKGNNSCKRLPSEPMYFLIVFFRYRFRFFRKSYLQNNDVSVKYGQFISG